MIERNWDGLVAYSDAAKKVAIGYVGGLNNKVRVIQFRPYGLRDEKYLRLTILTCISRNSKVPPFLPIRIHEEPFNEKSIEGDTEK